MIMQEDKFSFKRVGLLLKKYYTEDKNRQLLLFGVAFVVMLLLFYFITNISGSIHSDSIVVNSNVYTDTFTTPFLFFLSVFFFSLFLSYSAAHASTQLSSKPKQLAYQLLPAGIAEKFSVSMITSLLVVFLQFVAAYFLADVIQMIWSGHFFTINWSSLVALIQHPSASTKTVGDLVFQIVLYLLFVHAYFLFCGTIFRKHAFLLGIVLGFALSALSSILFGMLNGNFSYSSNSMTFGASASFNNVSTIFVVVLTLLLWVLSYFRLKKIEL